MQGFSYSERGRLRSTVAPPRRSEYARTVDWFGIVIAVVLGLAVILSLLDDRFDWYQRLTRR